MEQLQTSQPESFNELKNLFVGKAAHSLLSVAVSCNQTKIVEWLLENGADVNWHVIDDPNFTLIHCVALHGTVNALTILKEKTPVLWWQRAINQRAKNGNTPLVIATAKNQALMIEWLLENGADVNCHDVRIPSLTLVHIAARNDAVNALTTLKEKASALFLRTIDHNNRKDRDPLFEAARMNRTNAIAWLLQYVPFLHAHHIIQLITNTDDATESLQLLKNSNALRFEAGNDEQYAFLSALQYRRHKTLDWLMANRSCQINPHEIQHAAAYFQNEFATLYQRKVESDRTQTGQDQVQRDFRARFDLMLRYMHSCEPVFRTMKFMPTIFKDCRKMAKQFGVLVYSKNRVTGNDMSLTEISCIISYVNSENFHLDLLGTYLADTRNLTWRQYVARIAADLDLKSEENIKKVDSAITQKMSPYFIVADCLAKRIHQEIRQRWTGVAENNLDDIRHIIIEFFMQNTVLMEMAFRMLPKSEVTAKKNYEPLPIDTLKAVVKAIVTITEEQGHPFLNKRNIESVLAQHFLQDNIVEQQANDKKRSAVDLSSSHEDKRARSLSPSIFKNTAKRKNGNALPPTKKPTQTAGPRQ